MPASPELSVIIPCYDAARLIERTVDELRDYLVGLSRTWEVVLVDDGSRDATAEIVASLAEEACVRAVLLESNRGKGRAVAEGMAAAKGACRIFTDADLPYRLNAIAQCAELILEGGAHAVYGNRLLEESAARDQSLLRGLAGTGVRAVTGRLLGRSDVDTQCGFKGFSAPLARKLFPRLRIDGFLFDVEATLLLIRADVPIEFLPVELVNHSPSTVHLMRTGIMTMHEAWRIWRDLRHEVWDVAGLRAFDTTAAPARGS